MLNITWATIVEIKRILFTRGFFLDRIVNHGRIIQTQCLVLEIVTITLANRGPDARSTSMLKLMLLEAGVKSTILA